MADTKISALPASTTPLAGSEVLPIVQSGATKQVSVANLTDGRDVAAKSATLTQTTVGSGGFKIAAEVLATDYPATRFLNTTGNDGFLFGWDTDHVTIATNTTNGVAGTERVAIYKTTGDVKLNTGNIVPATAAKGVNFTANTGAAGMTSQLLNWYEEGTWTPSISGDGGSAGSVAFTSVGYYTRVGRLVTLHGYVAFTNLGSWTGRVGVTNVPYSANTVAAYGSSLVTKATIANALNVGCSIGAVSYTQINFPWSSDSGGGGDNVRFTDLSADSFLTFTITYITA